MAEVKIGESTATVAKLNGYKAAEALSIISEITEQTPDLLNELAEFSRKYAVENAQRMPRAAAEARFPSQAKNVSEEAWAAAGNELVIPEPPDLPEQIAFALPKVYSQARKSLTDLLALMVTPNAALQKADEDGLDIYSKDGPLAAGRTLLMHEAALEELVEVAATVGEVLREQLSSLDGGQLGKLMEVFGAKGAAKTEPQKAAPAPSEPSASAPDSPSASEPASDGPAETSSSVHPSERSAPQLAS